MERDPSDPFNDATLSMLRLVAEFLGPAIWTRRMADRGVLAVSRDRFIDVSEQLVGPEKTGAKLFAAVVMVFWILADPPLGVATTVFYLPFLVVADWVGGMDRSVGWTVFAIFFVGGWAFQLVGHGFEGRKPALLDNLVQIFVAPVFLMSEIWFALGLRRHLRRAVAARAPRYFETARDDHAAVHDSR